MSSWRRAKLYVFLLISGQLFSVAAVQAIDLTVDYGYDATNFFGSGNPGGAEAGGQARLAVESAADFFSGILNDTFAEIRTPEPFASSVFGGVATWSWSLNFANRTTGALTTLVDPTIAADEYRIYVGARSLSGNTLGKGGPGGFSSPVVTSNGGDFSIAEGNQINQTFSRFQQCGGDGKFPARHSENARGRARSRYCERNPQTPHRFGRGRAQRHWLEYRDPLFSPADYDVDGDDLVALAAGYAIDSGGDADGDGDTDSADFLAWQRQFTGPPASLIAAPVPEPGSAWRLVISLATTRRRRSARALTMLSSRASPHISSVSAAAA